MDKTHIGTAERYDVRARAQVVRLLGNETASVPCDNADSEGLL